MGLPNVPTASGYYTHGIPDNISCVIMILKWNDIPILRRIYRMTPHRRVLLRHVDRRTRRSACFPARFICESMVFLPCPLGALNSQTC